MKETHGSTGVAPGRIVEIIEQLEAEGADVTVTALRERLGTTSYSTFGAVLNDWRQEQARAARPAIPEVPEALAHLLRHLQAEVERLRAEGEKSTENLTAWIERASKAVMRLEEAAKANNEDVAGKRNSDG